MQKRFLPKADIEYAIKTFKFKKDALIYLNCTLGVLNKNLVYYNLTYPTIHWRKGVYDKVPEVNKQWLIDNWLNTNKSLGALSKELNVNVQLLEKRCRDFGLRKQFKYQLNTQKFFNLNDPHIWYVAGLTATDGYLPKCQNAVELGLRGEQEYDLLHEIKQYYEITSPIINYSNAWRLRVVCSGLNEFFYENFNIPNGAKTFCVGCPANIPNENCVKAYVLGCFDGDGCIGLKGTSSLLTAQETFIDGLVEIINTYQGITCKKHYDRNFPCISICKGKGKTFLTWMYQVENCFKLQRKYERYKQVNDIV